MLTHAQGYLFVAFSTGSLSSVDEYDVYIRFSPPLLHGHTYTFAIGGVNDEAGNAMVPANYTFVYKEVQRLCGCAVPDVPGLMRASACVARSWELV